MNKLKLFVVAVAALCCTLGASAQKSGYISLDQVVALMPEATRLDSIMQVYQTDSLNPQYAYMISEYQRKDSLVNGKDSLKNYPAASVRNQIRNELEGLAYQIQNWQQLAQNAMQSKQNSLLEPIYRKVMNALNTVAKENGYAFVYSREALLVAPPADDLLPLVAKKLNIKLPAGATQTAPPAAPKK